MKDDAQVAESRAIALPAAGYLLSAVIVVGGLGVYYFVFEVLVDPLNPVDALPEVRAPFLWEGQSPVSQAAVLAADLNARYAFAVPSVLMLMSFIAALIVAFGLVLPHFGRWAVALGVLSLPLGAAIGWYEQDANPLRAIVPTVLRGQRVRPARSTRQHCGRHRAGRSSVRIPLRRCSFSCT